MHAAVWWHYRRRHGCPGYVWAVGKVWGWGEGECEDGRPQSRPHTTFIPPPPPGQVLDCFLKVLGEKVNPKKEVRAPSNV